MASRNKQGDSGGTNFGTGKEGFSPPIRTTMPDEILRHEISDEELGMLGATRKDYTVELAYVLLGAVLGSIMPTLRHIYGSYLAKEIVPLSGFDFIETCLFVLFLGGCAIAFYATSQKKSQRDTLVEAIRKRTKSRIADR